jgi:hypothetical protein
VTTTKKVRLYLFKQPDVPCKNGFIIPKEVMQRTIDHFNRKTSNTHVFMPDEDRRIGAWIDHSVDKVEYDEKKNVYFVDAFLMPNFTANDFRGYRIDWVGFGEVLPRDEHGISIVKSLIDNIQYFELVKRKEGKCRKDLKS